MPWLHLHGVEQEVDDRLVIKGHDLLQPPRRLPSNLLVAKVLVGLATDTRIEYSPASKVNYFRASVVQFSVHVWWS